MAMDIQKLKEDLMKDIGTDSFTTPPSDFKNPFEEFNDAHITAADDYTTYVDKAKTYTDVSVGINVNTGEVISADMLSHESDLHPAQANFLWWVWFNKRLITETDEFNVTEEDFDRVKSIVKTRKYYNKGEKELLNRLRNELKELYLHAWQHIGEGDWIWVSNKAYRIQKVKRDLSDGARALYYYGDKQIWFNANCEETIKNKLYYNEITEHLTQVAENEKGFDIGEAFELYRNGSRGVVPTNNYGVDTYYDVRSDSFYYHGVTIFEKGEWATVI